MSGVFNGIAVRRHRSSRTARSASSLLTVLGRMLSHYQTAQRLLRTIWTVTALSPHHCHRTHPSQYAGAV